MSKTVNIYNLGIHLFDSMLTRCIYKSPTDLEEREYNKECLAFVKKTDKVSFIFRSNNYFDNEFIKRYIQIINKLYKYNRITIKKLNKKEHVYTVRVTNKKGRNYNNYVLTVFLRYLYQKRYRNIPLHFMEFYHRTKNLHLSIYLSHLYMRMDLSYYGFFKNSIDNTLLDINIKSKKSILYKTFNTGTSLNFFYTNTFDKFKVSYEDFQKLQYFILIKKYRKALLFYKSLVKKSRKPKINTKKSIFNNIINKLK